MATAAQQKRRAENLAFLQKPQIQAALVMISKSEGTFDYSRNQIEYGRIVKGKVLSSPYFPALVGKSNVVISDLSRFPLMLVNVRAGLNSSAAGGYQVIKNTWTGAAGAMGLTDFSPLSQDLVAVELLRQRGAIPYILKNDIAGALKFSSVSKEWASFAGAGYGQGENSVAKLVNWFQTALPGVRQTAADVAQTVEDNPGVSSAVVVVAALALFF